MSNTFLFDILYHDGPLTSVFKVSDDLLEIWDWQDQTETTNIWNVFNISPDNLKRYLRNEIQFKEFVSSGSNFKQVELNGDIETVGENVISVEEAANNDYQFEFSYTCQPDIIRKYLNDREIS